MTQVSVANIKGENRKRKQFLTNIKIKILNKLKYALFSSANQRTAIKGKKGHVCKTPKICNSKIHFRFTSGFWITKLIIALQERQGYLCCPITHSLIHNRICSLEIYSLAEQVSIATTKIALRFISSSTCWTVDLIVFFICKRKISEELFILICLTNLTNLTYLSVFSVFSNDQKVLQHRSN